MKTSELIKLKRKEKRLTLKDVANAVGVSEGTVSRWESGDIRELKRANIERLARLLDVSPAALLGIEEYLAEQIHRDQLIKELVDTSKSAQLKNLEIIIDVLKRLEGKQ